MRFATSSYNIVADVLTKQGYDLYFYKKMKKVPLKWTFLSEIQRV
jgi:hypothetical protein